MPTMMKHASKNTATLERLRSRRVSDASIISAATSFSSVDSDLPSGEIKQNVVDFHPEELDGLTPLRPDQVDECQLFELFQDHDFSFLFERSDASSDDATQRTSNCHSRKRKERSWSHHMIPEEETENDYEPEHKRQRLAANTL